MNTRGVRGRAAIRRAVGVVASGAWSVPEADLLRLLATSTVLPQAWANPDLYGEDGGRLTTPDVWFDEVGLAVMVHSRRFHGAELDWVSTVEADSDLVAAGVIVLGVTPMSISRSASTVLARVEAAWRSAARRRWRPPVTAVRRLTRP